MANLEGGLHTPPAVDAIIGRVDARHEELSRKVTGSIAAGIGEYGPQERGPEFWEDVREFGDTQIRGAMRAARTGLEPGPEEIAAIREATVRRVHQGVPLDGIHHAFRLGHRIVWNAVLEEADLLEEGRSAALGLTLPFMTYVDSVCTCIAEAYVEERHRLAAAADRDARDLLELLLAESPQAERLAASLGIEMGGDHYVLLVSPSAEAAWGGSEAAEAVRGALGGRATIVVQRTGATTCLLPAASAPAEKVAEALLSLDAGGRSSPIRAGIGLAHPAPEGVAASHREAQAALDLSGPARPVVDLSALSLFDYLVGRDDEVARAMVPEAVVRLAGSDGARDRGLLDTLFAYLRGGFSVKRAAAILPAHPNTVRYRLDRLSERTGCDPSDLPQMAELAMAVAVLRGGSGGRRR